MSLSSTVGRRHTVSVLALVFLGSGLIVASPADSVLAQAAGQGHTISGVRAINITSSSATIVWMTTGLAESQVMYGDAPWYGSATPRDPALVARHAQTLTGLRPGTTYHFRVSSVWPDGVLGSSGDFVFTTASAPRPARQASARTPASAPASPQKASRAGCTAPDPFAAAGGIGLCVQGDWVQLWMPSKPATPRRRRGGR